MSKFEVGDRLRASETASVYVTCDQVYVVLQAKGDDRQQVEILSDCGRAAWLHSHRFELYAKAGTFVAGDIVIAKDNHQDYCGGFHFGDMFVVEEAFGGKYVGLVGRRGSAGFSSFRLATPEEIAEANGPTRMARELMQKLRDNDTKARTEIPAADFDFSTIKAGDELVLRYRVLRDGIDDGNVMVHQPDFGGYYFRPAVFSSVIPAPKPKTLRERAIEAAKDAKRYAMGEGWIDDLVDAVLAEVEKGQ